MFFDEAHGVVDGFADVVAFGQIDEVVELGFGWEVENVFGLVVDWSYCSASAAGSFEFCFGLVEAVSCETQKQETQYGC